MTTAAAAFFTRFFQLAENSDFCFESDKAEKIE
jgi:hypothetical protein